MRTTRYPLLPQGFHHFTVFTVINRQYIRCRRISIAARQVLIRQGDRVKRAADRRRRPAPDYQPGQRVWLSAKDLHLKVPYKKLAPRFVGPFPVTRKVGPAAVRLRLPRSLRVHPTFHISQGKPVRESPMVPSFLSCQFPVLFLKSNFPLISGHLPFLLCHRSFVPPDP